MAENITVPGIDVDLLREQRNLVLTTIERYAFVVEHEKKEEEKDLLIGLVNLLDGMLDIAEGYPEPIQQNREVRKEKVDDSAN